MFSRHLGQAIQILNPERVIRHYEKFEHFPSIFSILFALNNEVLIFPSAKILVFQIKPFRFAGQRDKWNNQFLVGCISAPTAVRIPSVNINGFLCCRNLSISVLRPFIDFQNLYGWIIWHKKSLLCLNRANRECHSGMMKWISFYNRNVVCCNRCNRKITVWACKLLIPFHCRKT